MINAGSTRELVLEFFGMDGRRYAPSSFAYRIIDVASSAVIHAPTTLPATKVITIPLSATDTALVGAGQTEKHRVLWIAAAGTPEQETGDYYFEVRNVG